MTRIVIDVLLLGVNTLSTLQYLQFLPILFIYSVALRPVIKCLFLVQATGFVEILINPILNLTKSASNHWLIYLLK